MRHMTNWPMELGRKNNDIYYKFLIYNALKDVINVTIMMFVDRIGHKYNHNLLSLVVRFNIIILL